MKPNPLSRAAARAFILLAAIATVPSVNAAPGSSDVLSKPEPVCNTAAWDKQSAAQCPQALDSQLESLVAQAVSGEAGLVQDLVSEKQTGPRSIGEMVRVETSLNFDSPVVAQKLQDPLPTGQVPAPAAGMLVIIGFFAWQFGRLRSTVFSSRR